MTGQEYLSDALQFLEDELLEEADRVRRKRRRQRTLVRRWTAAGAGVCAAALLLLLLPGGADVTEEEKPGAETAEGYPSGDGSQPSPSPAGEAEDYGELERLSFSEIPADGLGYAEYMAYDISEIVNANPWNPSLELVSLPVFRNQQYGETVLLPEAAEEKIREMRELLVQTAQRLDIPAEELVIAEDAPTAEMLEKEAALAAASVSAAWQDIRIRVGRDMTVEIQFTEPREMPESFRFSRPSYEESEKTAGYLKDAYRELLNMEEPRINIHGGDYAYSGQQMPYQISFYEGAGNAEEQILHYNFCSADFCLDDAGDLFLIRIYNENLSEKAGDYPVITAEEAESLLEAGFYVTSVPCEIGEASQIAGAELVYRKGDDCEYLMPYYEFYVELPEEKEENGLNHYGIYYVPAVEREFLAEGAE